MAKAAAQAAKDDDVAGYVLEHQAGHLLRRAHQRHTTIFQDGMGEVQLTPTQYAALVKIRDLGQISQNQLGRLTAMDPATIQGVVRRLEERQLIERASDPEDRRRSMLKLTPSGETLVERLRADAHAVSRAILEPLSGDERRTLLRLLGAIS
jgi:DNA-binding MarR family transcriptional regulator